MKYYYLAPRKLSINFIAFVITIILGIFFHMSKDGILLFSMSSAMRSILKLSVYTAMQHTE